MASKYSMNDRPSWPRRAIVTAGEPYGNTYIGIRKSILHLFFFFLCLSKFICTFITIKTCHI